MKGIVVKTYLNSIFFFQGFTALHHAAQLPTKTMANLLILFGTDKNRVARVSEIKCDDFYYLDFFLTIHLFYFLYIFTSKN